MVDFIGPSGSTRIVETLIQDDLASAYVAYDGTRSSRLAIVSLALWTPNQGFRTSMNVTIRTLPTETQTAVMRVLSSPGGALSQDNLRYSGLRWTYESRRKGYEVSQQGRCIAVADGGLSVTVPAAAAVLVTL